MPTFLYELAPIPKWYVADLTGKPLGAGYMQAFRNEDHSTTKLVYQDASGLLPWPTVSKSGIPSILFDENGSQGPFYWETDPADPTDLYYLRFYDLNDV